MVVCRQAKLTLDDLELMTIGMCLDYLEEYIELNKPEDQKGPRQATQRDFDSF